MFPHLLSAAVAAAAVTITARFILSIEDRALSIGGDVGRRCALHNNNNTRIQSHIFFSQSIFIEHNIIII